MSHAEAGPPPRLEQLAKSVGEWEGEDFVRDDSSDEILGADATLRRHYRGRDGADVWLFVAYFSKQQVNKQIHSPRNCLPGGGWKMGAVERTRLGVRGAEREVMRLQIRRRTQSQEVLYWIHTQGGAVGDEYGLKWDLVKQAVRGRPTNAAFVRYNAAIADSDKMRELIGLLDGSMSQVLGTAGLR